MEIKGINYVLESNMFTRLYECYILSNVQPLLTHLSVLLHCV